MKKLTDKELIEAIDLIKAVAYLGVDFGYGAFFLSKEHAMRAQKWLINYETKKHEKTN